MIIKAIKASLLGMMALVAMPVLGQDLMARQAPIDRRLKAVDSVSLQRLIHNESTQTLSTIYPNWNNKYVANYKVELPDSFRIDLRHFCMPTPSRRVTSNFGYRPAFRRVHKGLDIKVYIGDTIRAAFSGKVRIVRYDARGYGKYVVIRHGNGLETVYGHLSKQLVDEDQVVKVGEPIGLGGNTGLSTGSHLHFETRLLGEAINPALLFDFANQDVTNDFYTYVKNNYTRESELASAKVEREIPSNGNEPAPEGTDAKAEVRFHKVAGGESLYSIAQRYDLSVDKLCQLNRLTRKSKLRTGQILRCM